MTEQGNPDRACPHLNFAVEAQVIRITADGTESGDLTGLQADVKVLCMDCGEPMRWTGLQAGISNDRPMCSVDETELRAPLRPASSDPDFGLGVLPERFKGVGPSHDGDCSDACWQ